MIQRASIRSSVFSLEGRHSNSCVFFTLGTKTDLGQPQENCCYWRIPIAGKISTMVFDKTGTITKAPYDGALCHDFSTCSVVEPCVAAKSVAKSKTKWKHQAGMDFAGVYGVSGQLFGGKVRNWLGPLVQMFGHTPLFRLQVGASTTQLVWKVQFDDMDPESEKNRSLIDTPCGSQVHMCAPYNWNWTQEI